MKKLWPLPLAALLCASPLQAQVLAPGLLGAIGGFRLVTANTSAALVMGFFIHRTLEDAAARRASAFSSSPGPSTPASVEA